MATHETKILEVRDVATCVPVVATRLAPLESNPAEDRVRWLLRTAGYGDPLILLTRANGGEAHYDPYSWGDPWWREVHAHIEQEWDTLGDGDMVDVSPRFDRGPMESDYNSHW